MTAGPAIVWFRRDLRLDDNPAWQAASAGHDELVAVFVLEPMLLDRAGAHRRSQLLAHLAALDGSLRDLGGALTVRAGPADVALPRIVAESSASAVFLNEDVSPFARSRDRAVARATPVPIEGFHGHLVHEPGAVLTRAGHLSRVFSAFFRTWCRTEPRPWPSGGRAAVVALGGEDLPVGDPPRQPAGSEAAQDRLARWAERVDDYPATRDIPSVDGTSDLSADLKFGTLSPRTVIDRIGTSTDGREAYVRQVAWRDWCAHTLANHPSLATRPMREEYERIEWNDDRRDLDAWAEGRTGYPIVDAGMRQLLATGWMHNRVRMICASFLVKDLLVDWRRGERLFRHRLVDGDTAQNAGNWQWVAGTGLDAAPYFRMFNPTTQSRRFDESGAYIRSWVPELAPLDDATIHEPAADRAAAAAAGVVVGRHYPEPIVDHAEARARAREAYAAVRT